MCDGASLASAGSDLIGGLVGASDARSRAALEAAQLDAMKMMASARASAQEGAMRRDMAEHIGQNLAAGAVAGIAAASFETVAEGNDADMSRNLRTNYRNTAIEVAGLDIQKSMALAEGKAQAMVAMMGGFTRARSTLYDGEKAYQAAHTGQTRREYLARSIRGK